MTMRGFSLQLPASRSSALLLAIILVAALRIAMTYGVFNQTTDEPAHIVTGLEWLELGTYLYEPLHPPLARVAAAMGPFLDGLRLPEAQRSFLADLKASDRLRNRYGTHQAYDGYYDSVVNAAMWSTGNEVLYSSGSYWRHLTLARLGILPFFLIGSVSVWGIARRLFGARVAATSLLLFTTLPPILAHAGLATTDMAGAATVALWTYAFLLWLEEPRFRRGLVLGAATALAILAKFSALLFLPASAGAVLLWHASLPNLSSSLSWAAARRRLASLLPGAAASFFIVWAGYRFSLGPLAPASQRPHSPIDRLLGSNPVLHDLAYALAETSVFPAVPLLDGLDQLWYRNQTADESYLLGQVSTGSRWAFFPVALAVKTPLGFLLLSVTGLVASAIESRRTNNPAAFAPGAVGCAILLASLPSRIHIGLRHVLPMYPFLAILAGYAACKLWDLDRPKQAGRLLAAGLLGWHLLSSFVAHPDYLAYFNELAGSNPERVLVDSDLDWGQDLARLADELRERDVQSVSLACFGTADLSRHGLPAYTLLPEGSPKEGWIAISLTILQKDDGYRWLQRYRPVSRVGRSIMLYYVSD